MKKYLVFLISIFAVASFAQENTEEFEYPKHHIGVSASSISGSGVSYKYRAESGFAFKLTGFAYYLQTEEENQNFDNTEFWYNVGSELQYDIFNPNQGRLFVFLGASYRFSNDEYSNNEFDEEYRFSIGPGVGYEYYFWERLSINAELGFNYSYREDTYSYSWNSQNNPTKRTEIGLFFGGGIGLSYSF